MQKFFAELGTVMIDRGLGWIVFGIKLLANSFVKL